MPTDPAPPLDLAAIEARQRAYRAWIEAQEEATPTRLVLDDVPALVARIRELETEGCPYCTLITELEAQVAALAAEVARYADFREAADILAELRTVKPSSQRWLQLVGRFGMVTDALWRH